MAETPTQKTEAQIAAENKSLEYILGFIKRYQQYYNRRAQCMSGYQARAIREDREKGMARPDAGVLCLEVAKHSADVEADPKAKAERPDKALLGPFLAFAADKGLEPTMANAQMVLNLYVQQPTIPEVAAMNGASVKVTPKSGNDAKTAEFILTPASALEAAFTREVLNVYYHGKTPANPTKTTPTELAELAGVTNICYRNTVEATQGQCAQAGREQAAIYLAGKRRASNQR